VARTLQIAAIADCETAIGGREVDNAKALLGGWWIRVNLGCHLVWFEG
jgi:hypothetical protein